MSIYSFFYYTMAIPIVCLILLLLPFPRFIKNVSLAANYFSLYNSLNDSKPNVSAPYDAQTYYHAKIWRAERNVYLSALTFVLWFGLYYIWTMNRKIDNLERQHNIDERKDNDDHKVEGEIETYDVGTRRRKQE